VVGLSLIYRELAASSQPDFDNQAKQIAARLGC